MEPDDGLERLADALKICGQFKRLFFEKKSQLSKYFKDKPTVEWDFKSSLIFARMDVFTSQMKLIEVLLLCYLIVTIASLVLFIGIFSHYHIFLEAGKDGLWRN